MLLWFTNVWCFFRMQGCFQFILQVFFLFKRFSHILSIFMNWKLYLKNGNEGFWWRNWKRKYWKATTIISFDNFNDLKHIHSTLWFFFWHNPNVFFFFLHLPKDQFFIFFPLHFCISSSKRTLQEHFVTLKKWTLCFWICIKPAKMRGLHGYKKHRRYCVSIDADMY